MPEQLVLANVYAIVRDRDRPGRILLQKRWKPESDPENSGRWELPGGKWRAFEPLASCAEREVLEESGLSDVEVQVNQTDYELMGDRVQVSDSIQLVQMLQGPYPSVLAVVDVVASGQPHATGDGSREAQWIEQESLMEMMQHEPESFTALSFAALRYRLFQQ
ncbi:NUDIX domain-containing protein [Brachybacterium sp. Marseille-Q7125]|uniref:NUDIX hydrolase n=1 Tax=Brachybacterium sp. Marseille-Q7125 TaxID=2932815 RepID=UPI001FF2D2BD|nr:NUDIX domain-containing protein [Brachybacterium sp. Marseille-Q7125]